MNKFRQHTPNMRFKQNNSWNRNSMHHNHFTQRTFNINSTWSSRHQVVRRMPVRHILPGSERYWCETCDKGFMTTTLLDSHTQRHQKCNIDGCQFVAHPLVITRHIQMQHATGLYKRIGTLNNPEEIKKWREERKKKYPTTENIERRKAEIKEKISRGEKMGLRRQTHGLKRSVYNRPVLPTRDKQAPALREKYTRTVLNRGGLTTQTSIPKKPLNRICKLGLPKEERRKLQPFRGIQDLIVEDTVEEEIPQQTNDLFEDEEEISDKEQNIDTTQPTVCGALSSLMCTYDSSDDEIEDNPKINTKTISTTINKKIKDKKQKNNVKITSCPVESENDSGPEETTINKEGPMINDDPKPKVTRKERLQRLAISKNKSRFINLKRKLPSTLLEKLLHKEIQHERNVILQCVRYVIENNYFEK